MQVCEGAVEKEHGAQGSGLLGSEEEMGRLQLSSKENKAEVRFFSILRLEADMGMRQHSKGACLLRFVSS